MVFSIIVSLLIVIILPSIAMFSEIYYLEIGRGYPSYLGYFEFITVIILFVYALLPVLLPSKRYFKSQSSENLVAEYEFLKKLMYVGIPLLVIVMIIFLRTFQPERLNFSYALFPGLILIVGGALLRIISNTAKKDFRYYYARGCFHLLSKRGDRAEKMSYLIMGINSYNKYLKRTIKLQISNINKIYSKILVDSLLDKKDFTSSISSEFQSDDKLKPTKYLLNMLNRTDDILTKEPLWDKIKEWGAFLAAIIPVVISIIQFLFSTSSQAID
jgi:hypothetical protein